MPLKRSISGISNLKGKLWLIGAVSETGKQSGGQNTGEGREEA